MTAMSKQALRAWLRKQSRGADARAAESALLCSHVLNSDLFKGAQVIGGYMPLPWEADVLDILKAALQQGKTLALPLCQTPPVMTLREVAALAELHAGAYGILEPSADAPVIPPERIDLLLVPLEGIAPSGYRLGKGGGYYDCLLASADVPAMGCALSWQWTDNIPYDPWDKKLLACADCQGIHWFYPS